MKDERIDSAPIEGETTTIVIARERSSLPASGGTEAIYFADSLEQWQGLK